jgi:hypothetical protein
MHTYIHTYVHTGSDQPGKWRPTPPSYQPALSPEFATTEEPWLMQSADEFRMPPPPALDSEVYRLSYMQGT